MVFLPLYDRNPRHRIPFQYVTVALIGICVVIYLMQSDLGGRAGHALVLGLGIVPSVLTGQAQLPADLYLVPAWMTLLTSAFLHTGFWHLFGNMLYLWIFGDNVEDSMGHGRFGAFYALCAVVAGLTQVVADPASNVPVIGASGAISGVLGAYLMLHPRRRVWVLIIFRTWPMPVWLVLGMWIAFQVAAVTVFYDADSGTAFWAHIGGFVAGAILIIPFRHKSVPLFDRPARRRP